MMDFFDWFESTIRIEIFYVYKYVLCGVNMRTLENDWRNFEFILYLNEL
jgi:hypothetical protein